MTVDINYAVYSQNRSAQEFKFNSVLRGGVYCLIFNMYKIF